MKKLLVCVVLMVLCVPCFGRHFTNTVVPEEYCMDCSDSSMFLYVGDYLGGYGISAYVCQPNFNYDIDTGDLLIIYDYKKRGSSRVGGKTYNQPVFQCEYNEDKKQYEWVPYNNDICGVSIDSVINTFENGYYGVPEIIKPDDQCDMAKVVMKSTGKNNSDEKYGVICNNDVIGKEIFYVENHIINKDTSFWVCTVTGWKQSKQNYHFEYCKGDEAPPPSGWADIGVYKSFLDEIYHIYTPQQPKEKNVYENGAGFVCGGCPAGTLIEGGCSDAFEILNCDALGKVWDFENDICIEKNAKAESEDVNDEIENAKKVLSSFFERAENNKNVWKDAEGNFNTARLASDLTAGVVLGTVGGVVSGVVIKKKQVEKGFNALHCTVGGQTVADWGDTFRIGIQK